jgi:hypothetical protein
MRMFNRALLSKWLWRCGIERDAWWRIVGDFKYGSFWEGAPLSPQEPLGWGCERTLEKVGRLSQAAPNSVKMGNETTSF